MLSDPSFSTVMCEIGDDLKDRFWAAPLSRGIPRWYRSACSRPFGVTKGVGVTNWFW